MYKIFLLFSLCVKLIFSATPEQVEQYLLVSNAEETLLKLESEFSSMQNNFNQNSKEENKTYDMQLVPLRFKEYLERNLSEDEMNAVLVNYKSFILLQFISISTQDDYDKNESKSYLKKIKASSEASKRIALVADISKEFYHKEAILIMFNELMKPLFQNAKGFSKVNDNFIKQRQENYIKKNIQNTYNETLFFTKDFSIEELGLLLKIAKTSAKNHEVRAVYGATAYALKEFFLSIASRYDISKH